MYKNMTLVPVTDSLRGVAYPYVHINVLTQVDDTMGDELTECQRNINNTVDKINQGNSLGYGLGRLLRTIFDFAQDRYQGYAPIHRAVINQDVYELCDLLEDKQDDIDALDYHGETAVHLAVKNNNQRIIKILIENNANLNIPNEYGETPIHMAVKQGHFETYLLLKSAGANLFILDNLGQSLLHLAASLTSTDILKDLLAEGLDIDAQDHELNTPLHFAAQYNMFESAKTMFLLGANALAKNYEGEIPRDKLSDLQLQIWFKYFELLQYAQAFQTDSKKSISRISDHVFVKKKSTGISKGGFYRNKQGELVLLKMDIPQSWQTTFNEYIASGLYTLLLKEYVPSTQLVLDSDNHALWLGSPIINGFQSFFDIDSNFEQYSPSDQDMLQYGEILFKINGMPIINYQRVIAATTLLQDPDVNPGNIGVVRVNNTYITTKIDYGFAFYKIEYEDIKSFESLFHWHFSECSLAQVGYLRLRDEVEELSKTRIVDIEKVIDDKIEDIKLVLLGYVQDRINNRGSLYYSEKLQEINLNHLKSKIMEVVKRKLLDFKRLAFDMKLEGAIYNNDKDLVDQLLQGNEYEKPLIPAFHKMYMNTDNCKEVTLGANRLSPDAVAILYNKIELASHIRSRYQ